MKSTKDRDNRNNRDPILQKGVVVFLDALGTKTVWSRKEPSKYIEAWGNVIGLIRENAELYDKATQNDAISPKLNVIAFSDTIILSLSHNLDKFKENLNLFTPYLIIGIILRYMLYNAIIEEDIYLRGVISSGEFYVKDSMIIGPAVEEAAEWYEKPEWFGVSTTPSATYGIKFLRENGNLSDEALNESFISYPVPMKNNPTLESYAVLWPTGGVYYKIKVEKVAISFEARTSEDRKKVLKNSKIKLLESFSSSGLIGVSSELKYKNTLDFFDYVAETLSK